MIKKCPIKRIEKFLNREVKISKLDLKNIKDEIDKSIHKDLDKAKASKWPNPKDLFLNVRNVDEV